LDRGRGPSAKLIAPQLLPAEHVLEPRRVGIEFGHEGVAARIDGPGEQGIESERNTSIFEQRPSLIDCRAIPIRVGNTML
jgi:hypothetical protein